MDSHIDAFDVEHPELGLKDDLEAFMGGDPDELVGEHATTDAAYQVWLIERATAIVGAVLGTDELEWERWQLRSPRVCRALDILQTVDAWIADRARS